MPDTEPLPIVSVASKAESKPPIEVQAAKPKVEKPKLSERVKGKIAEWRGLLGKEKQHQVLEEISTAPSHEDGLFKSTEDVQTQSQEAMPRNDASIKEEEMSAHEETKETASPIQTESSQDTKISDGTSQVKESESGSGNQQETEKEKHKITPEKDEGLSETLDKAQNLIAIIGESGVEVTSEESGDPALLVLTEAVNGVKIAEQQVQTLLNNKEEGAIPEGANQAGVSGQISKLKLKALSSSRENVYAEATVKSEKAFEDSRENLHDQLTQEVDKIGQRVSEISGKPEDETSEISTKVTWMARGGLGRVETKRHEIPTSDRLLREAESTTKETSEGMRELSEARKSLGRQISLDLSFKLDTTERRLVDMDKNLSSERSRRVEVTGEALRDLVGDSWHDEAVLIEGGQSVPVRGFSELSGPLKLGTGVSNLERYVHTPTNEQVDQMAEVRKKAVDYVSKQDKVKAKKLDEQLSETEKFMRERNADYVEKCRQISESAVVHMSSEEGMKKILGSGELHSQVSQRESGNDPLTASARGEQEELPSLSFFVNGNDDKHGELAIVMPYSEAVKERTFFEKGYSFGGTGPDELHVHDADYNIGDPESQGANVSIESAKFACPEDQKEKWETYLTTPKENGGAGRTKEWTEEHLVTYKESLSEVIEEVKEEAKSRPPGRLVPTQNKSLETGSRTRVTLFKYESV